jgi:hypothetical protein
VTTVFRTAPTAAALHPSGVARLPSGAWVTRLPLVDSAAPPLFARLTYRDAQSAAARLGGRLPTREEIVSLISAGHIITPTTLSWGPEMVERGHAEDHDASMAAKLDATRWDGVKPVMGAGKWWTAGATGENVRICGWWDGRQLIQSGVALDNPKHLGAAQSHVDYGTLCMVAFDVEPASAEPHGHELVPRSLGLRALDVAREHLERGVREVPGPGTDPQVLAYHYPARRGGSPVAGILDATGARLGLADDGLAWCASFASFCLSLAIDGTADADRLACPHGYRCSVAELYADAKARGSLRPPSWRPRPGDLALWRRAGGDPSRGGTGHVARVLSVSETGFRCIDGNSQDAVVETAHTWGEPSLVGWISYERTT